MKVFVTGATGFLGNYLVRRLGSLGFEVTAMGRDPIKGKQLESKCVRFLALGLSQEAELKKALSAHEVVVHCAALSSPWGKLQDFVQTNVIGTQNLLSAAQHANVKRFIHISTPSIYVEPIDKLNIKEDDVLPLHQINYYAKTKLEAERKVDAACKSGLSAITLRPQGIFGPEDTSIFPRIIHTAKKGFFPVIADGQNTIDVTYVENVVDAILCALNASSAANGMKFNITNDAPIKNYEKIDQVLQALNISYKKKHLSFRKAWNIAYAMELGCRYLFKNTEPLLTRYSVCALSKSRTLDITKAKSILNYRPKVSVEEGFERYIQWYQKSN